MNDGADFDWLPGYEPTRASYRVQTCLVVPTPARVGVASSSRRRRSGPSGSR